MTLRIILSRLMRPNMAALLIAFILLGIATFMKPLSLNTPVYSVQIAFDISQSMNVRDIMVGTSELSRIEYAKQTAKQLLSKLPCGSSIGWSAFTGRRTLALITPLEVCEHYAGLLSSLEQINGGMRWSNASIIGKGLHQLMRTAYESEEKTVVLLFTDGHEAPPLATGQRGMPSTDKFDVDGFIVGIGNTTPMPIPKTLSDGRTGIVWQAHEVVQRVDVPVGSSHEELSSRHDSHMQLLAGLANLSYLPMPSVSTILTEIQRSEHSQTRQSRRELRWIPALLALLILCWRCSPGWADFKNAVSFHTNR